MKRTLIREIAGNIWDYIDQGYIVVTTNGFVKTDGRCVMGRGLALQAAHRFPELPLLLGRAITESGNHVYHFSFEAEIVTFPVKEVWWKPAEQHIIQRSCQELLNLFEKSDFKGDEKIFISRAGCDNGRLDWKTQVLPIFEQEFGDDPRITIVDRRAQ